MYNVFKKEFRSYFNSPIAYIVLVVFIGVSGWFFSQQLFLGGQANISGFLGIAPLLFLLLIPAICMRLIAEERSLGTIEVLSTLPLKDHEIVIGKWLASFALILVGLCATLIYPITVAFLGPLDWGSVSASYIGLVLLSLFFTSIGIFTSSITSSQIVAFVVGVVISFFFFVIGKILFVIPSPFVSIFEYLGIDYHFTSITRGVIDSRNVIYFLSVTFLFVYGAIYNVRKTKDYIIRGAYIVSICVIVLLVNFLSYRIFYRIDLTEGNIYSLSPASVKLARKLSDPVVIRAYVTSELPYPYNNRAKYVKDILSEFKQRSKGKVRYELVNPDTREKMIEAQRNGIIPLQFTEVKEGEFGVKQGFMGLIFLYEDKKESIPVIEDLSTLEYDIISRIRKLIRTEQTIVALTEGHGEVTLHERVMQKIKEQYRVKNIDLEKNNITKDIKTLLIVGPKKDFSKETTEKIKKFIGEGGAVGIFVDKYNINLDYFFATPLQLPNLDTLVAEYGIKLIPALVMDKKNEMIGIRSQMGFFTMQNFVPYPFFPKLVDLSKEHSITRNLDALTLPYVSPIEGGDIIANTSRESWLREKPQTLNPLDKERFLPFALPNEKKGPFGVVSSLIGNKRLLLVGTSRFVDPQFMSNSGISFFLNSLDWLTQDEELISIRSKGVSDRPLKQISSGLKRLTRWVNMLLPSLVFIAIGGTRWRKRRKIQYG